MFIVSPFRALRGHLGLVAGLALLALSPAPLLAQLNSPSAADGYDPNVNGTVFALAVQSNGKSIVAGNFNNVGGFARNNIARVNVDGSVDQTFDPNVNGRINAVVVQSDGKILIGGYFTTVQPNGAGSATVRNHVARLNADGTLDTSFNPNVGGVLAPEVEAILIQSDGRIVLGGTFTTAQPNGAATVTTRNRVARFNADGTLDAGFDPNVDRVVLSIAQQSDGKLILGGGFTMVQPNGASTATVRTSIARLNIDGSVDTGYDPEPNNGVTKVVVQPDDRVIAAGYFTTVAPNGAGAATNAIHLARFNGDGSIDTTYNPGVSGNIMTLQLQRNGGLILGGTFSAVQSVKRNYVARLNVDGTLDTVFDPEANYTVFAIAEQSDGSILLGGNFTQLQPNSATAPTTRNGLARVNVNGTLDSDFAPDTNGRVLSLLVQSDGKALVGGSFTSIAGVTRNYMARLNADGTLDTGFDPNLNGEVAAIALQGDGKILIGGSFTTVKGNSKLHMARLNADGSLDTSFEPNPDSKVAAIAVQSDGKILIGGYFLYVRPNGASASTARNRLARMNADGSLDISYDPQPGGPILAIKLQSDGQALVGGNFTSFTAGNRANIARIQTDGTVDPNYNPIANQQVNAIVIQSDGKAVIGGAFTYLQPVNAPVVTTDTKNADGTTTTTKTTTSFRRGIARINTDGTVDPAFDPSTNNVVRTLALQSDGKIIAGGLFTSLTPNSSTSSTSRIYLVRLNSADGGIDGNFNTGIVEGVGNQVIALALQSDGKVLVGGAFKAIQTPGTTAWVTRNQLARVGTNGTVDSSYAPSTGGPTGAVINSLTVQADGKILVGGSFSSFGGTLSSNLARFEAESVPDTTFNPNSDGAIYSVAARVSGGAIGTQFNDFAWLNNNGTLRTSFRPTAQLNGQVNAVAFQADGKILLAGSVKDATGVVNGNILRLNADGSLDTSFNPIVDNSVLSLAVQSDGKIVIGGNFITVNTISRQYIARLNSDGTLDTTFDPRANNAVNALVIQSDGKIVLGGAFTSIQPNSATDLTSINYLARVNSDGTYDKTFSPNPNGTIFAMALQSDGQLVVAGAFTTILAGTSQTTTLNRGHIARIKTDATTDATFDPNASGNVVALAIQDDGKIVLGGNFNFLQANSAPTIITRNNLARVNSDGSLDLSYDPEPNAAVVAMSKQTDGKVIIAGLFTSLRPSGAVVATARQSMARINTDGTLDNAFDPSPNGTISTVLSQSDGSVIIAGTFSSIEPTGTILVGGSFGSIGGVSLSNFALLNSGGSASASFAPNPNGTVYAIAVRPDNRVLIAGNYTTIGGVARKGVAQLNVDGSMDTSFNANAFVTGGPAVLMLQTDGKVILGGVSVGFGGTARGTLERLNADGSLDASFSPSGLGAINAVALQTDGKLLVGGGTPGRLVRLNADGTTDGTFTPAVNGDVNSLVVQSDGMIIVGGNFTSIAGSAYAYLARLNPNGSIDSTYNPNPDNAVRAMALQPGGKLLLGGSFANVSGKQRYGLARVAMTTPSAQTLDVTNGLSTVTWTRTGSSPALVGAVFEQSVDGRTWTTLGQASRVGSADTWQLGGQTLGSGASLFIRARGLTVNSQYSSSGVVETVRQFYSTSLPQIVGANTATATSGSSFYFGVTANVANATFAASGLPTGLTIDPITGIISGTTSQVGVFVVTLTATNAAGTTTSTLTLYVNAPSGGASVVHFAALSARAPVSTSDPLIAGLVVSGTTSRTVLLRAIGPGLTSYGVKSTISHPHMQLYSSSGVLMSENSGWGGSSALSAVFSQLGAFPLTVGSTDAAMVVTLAPGAYTVVVTDTTGASGIALAEVYDAGTNFTSSDPRMVALSARSAAGTGEGVMVGGFVINGTSSKHVLIRGVGPGLANYGVSTYMTDPLLRLYDSSGTLLAQNDNWGTPVTVIPAQPGATAAALILAASQSGATPLASGSTDAAIIVTLPPGAYTAQVSSQSGVAGTALVEVYELP